MMQTFIVKVEPLTAVHIGTGEDMDPMSYTIKGGRLLRFRPETVLSRLPEDKMSEFDLLIAAGEHQKIAGLLHSQLNEADTLYRMPASPQVSQKFKTGIGQDENQLLIGETYRDAASQKPVIPGSSLKGAIRTALADYLAQKNNTNPPVGKEVRRFEQMVFGHEDAKNDPLRAIKISDCSISGDNPQAASDFVNFKENRRRSDDFSRMSLMKEQIIGPLCGGDAHGICRLTIDEDLQQVKITLGKWQPLPEKFTLPDIVLACHKFYKANFLREYEKFYASSQYGELQGNAKKVLAEIEKIDPQKNQCLIRLGRFSQVENVTLNEPYREPKNKTYGDTRTLTEDYFPAGLVKLTFMRIAEYRHEQEAQALAEQKKAAEEQARLAAERAEQERLAAMTPDEKMLERIRELPADTDIIGKVVHECFENDLSSDVFIALKARLKEIGQWVPSGSKKRKEKLQKRNQTIESKIQES